MALERDAYWETISIVNGSLNSIALTLEILEKKFPWQAGTTCKGMDLASSNTEPYINELFV